MKPTCCRRSRGQRCARARCERELREPHLDEVDDVARHGVDVVRLGRLVCWNGRAADAAIVEHENWTSDESQLGHVGEEEEEASGRTWAVSSERVGEREPVYQADS